MLSEPPRVDCGHFTAEVTNGDLHMEVESQIWWLRPWFVWMQFRWLKWGRGVTQLLHYILKESLQRILVSLSWVFSYRHGV